MNTKELYQELVKETAKFHTELCSAELYSDSSESNPYFYTKYLSLLKSFYEIYNLLIGLGDYNDVWTEHETPAIGESVMTGVSAAVTEQNELIVRLPRIPKKQFNGNQLFVREIRYQLEKLYRLGKVPDMRQKYISIINIYSVSHSSYKIPDNLNWDTKKVIDVITDFTGGGDGGLNTFAFMASYQTDEIPAGMYILVSQYKHYGLDGIKNIFHIVVEEGQKSTK